ncbi:rCG52956 [Rattus norvegicus]|uniref:RCG52956 n=1 Tax=Rattus norvegicus TaxID=10116 RepID=A6IQH2_RAT|nr:rCG52956 [Rattus norvegicus]
MQLLIYSSLGMNLSTEASYLSIYGCFSQVVALVLEPGVEPSGEDARWLLLPRDGHIRPIWVKLVDFGFYYIMFIVP